MQLLMEESSAECKQTWWWTVRWWVHALTFLKNNPHLQVISGDQLWYIIKHVCI